MSGINRLIPLVAAAALGGLTAWAGPPTATVAIHDETSPGSGVLLLRNGQVIEGDILRTNDYFEITWPDQEVRVRAADVEFFCRNLEEGYERKRAALESDNLYERLELVQWCERNGMLKHAAEELGVAVEIDPNNPMIAVIRRRLQLAMEKPKTSAKPTVARPPLPTDSELDEMVRGLPPGSVETFVKQIQPILLNRSVAFSLQGPAPNGELELIRPPVGQFPNRRITQRNLYAILQCINWDDPGESRLLKAPHGPTGAVQPAIFTDHQMLQYRQLREWIYDVAQKPMPIEAPDEYLAPVVSTGFSDLGTAPTRPIAPPGRHQAKTSESSGAKSSATSGSRPSSSAFFGSGFDLNNAVDQSGAATLAKSAKGNAANTVPTNAAAAKANALRGGRTSKVQRGAPIPPSAENPLVSTGGVDPYDPEVFNHQFSASGSSVPMTPMATPAAQALRGGGE